MANTILITANWNTGALSQQTISRQYDNNRYAVRFVDYPEASDGNELDYYLLVWMSTAPGQKPGEITPIQLNSDQWYISNYFTQQVQVIKFQLCVLNEAGTYEAHSPIFSGRIGDSLEHDGTSQDIDVSTLFDAYREYVEELIIRAGAVIIDPTLTQSGQAADAKVVGDEIEGVKSAVLQRTNNLFDKNDADVFAGFDLTGTVQASTGAKSVIIPVNVTTETSVAAHRATIASRFALSAYTAKPVAGATSKYHDYNNSASSITITVDSTIKYLMIYLWRSDDSPITMEQMVDGLMVQFGSTYTGYEPYYVPKIADRQITNEKLSNDVNEQLTSGEIQDIIFDSSFNLWNTSLLEVMENTRCSGYNTTTYVITTAVADNYATAIMDIPQNIDKLKIKKPATIPSGGQMYVAISSSLHYASNRPFSSLSASFRDAFAEHTYGDDYYILNLAEMRNRGLEKLAISTYAESAMYVQADKITSDWLVCNPDIYCPVGAFGSIGAIGDSYTAGSIVKADNTWVDMPNQSYIAVMGKRAGIPWSNYGMGGTNTRTYITNKLPAVLSADANDFYFLALGINDSSLGASYIGSVSDIHDDDYTQNADSFYGNYGKIIAQVKAHAPNARFCMIKTPIYLAIWKELDTAIQTIADHYGFACIDPKDDLFFHSKTFYSRVSNHPSCIGYAGMAMAYERLLSKAIEKNPLYFFYANISGDTPEGIS